MFICINTDVRITSEWTDLEGGRATGLGRGQCTMLWVHSHKSKTKGT